MSRRMLRALASLPQIVIATSALLPGVGAAQVLPERPRTSVNTAYVAPTGRTLAVPAGGDFQAALNTAQLGDVITLQAGASYTGPFTLPKKAGTGWIIIRTSAPDTSLPRLGTRLTPAYAAVLPKLVAPHASSAIVTAPGAHHYRFLGVEIKQPPGAYVYNLVVLGTGEQVAADLPHHIILDRVYVHGNPSDGTVRGVALNGKHLAVINSTIAEIHDCGRDTQAIAGWTGPGPFKLVNNYLEAAGENVMFGGADPAIANLVPSDIEVRRNHFFKPLRWKADDPSFKPTASWCQGGGWTVKNIFELKNARRVLIDGNIFENNWEHAQNGFAILFTPRNQGGGCPWCTVQDVTFTNNIVRHTAAGVNILGRDQDSQFTERVLIRNNLFDDVSTNWGGSGRLFQILNGAKDVTIEHNTAFPTGAVLFASGAPNPGFVFRNNVSAFGSYGIAGDGTGTGTPTLTTYFPGALVQHNVLAGDSAAIYANSYPSNNFFYASLDRVGFVSRAAGDYRLAVSSPYKSAGIGSKDIGVDFAALDAAMTSR